MNIIIIKDKSFNFFTEFTVSLLKTQQCIICYDMIESQQPVIICCNTGNFIGHVYNVVNYGLLPINIVLYQEHPCLLNRE